MNQIIESEGVSVIIPDKAYAVKQYYKTPLGQFFNEDCFERMKNMKDKSVNLILSDLPYG